MILLFFMVLFVSYATSLNPVLVWWYFK